MFKYLIVLNMPLKTDWLVTVLLNYEAELYTIFLDFSVFTRPIIGFSTFKPDPITVFLSRFLKFIR